MSGSVTAGLVIGLLLIVVVAWIWFRGGRRLLTMPVIVLLTVLGIASIALMLGW